MSSLFDDVTDADTAAIDQCNDEGRRNCRKIATNQDVLDSLQSGDRVKLMAFYPHQEIILQLKYEPTATPRSKSYSFRMEINGEFAGDATITFGTTGYVIIKPSSHSKNS